MQLRIHYHRPPRGTPPSNHTIANFSDIDAIAREVVSDVKAWARAVPLNRSGSRLVLSLVAQWGEPVEKKKRR